MTKVMPISPRTILCTLVAILPSAPLFAEPVEVDVFTEVRFSDNMAQRSDSEKEADIEYRPGFSITHVKDPGQCNSALNAELAYLFYQQDTIDDQLSAQLNWNGDCEITPYFNWRASDRLQQATQNSRGTNTAANRELRNVFSTGPQVVIPLTNVDSFIGSVDWQRTDYEDNTDDNSQRWIGNARLQRLFSPVMQGWLNARYSDTEYDTGELLEETSYRVGLSRRISRTFLSGDVGITTLERDVNGTVNESTGAVWNLRATHSLDNAEVYASAARDFTDVSSDYQIAFGDVRFDFTQTQAVELTTFTVGGSTIVGDGYGLSGSVFYREYIYLDSDELEESIGTEIGVDKALSSNLTADARLQVLRQDFEPEGGSANEYSAILGLRYQRTSDLSFRLDVGRETQDGSGGSVAEYTENWIAATVTYNLR